MKKKFSSLALLLFALSIASCGSQNSSGTSTSVSETTPSISSASPTLPSVDSGTTGSASDTTLPSVSEDTTTSVSVDETVHVTSLSIEQDSVTLNEGETRAIDVEVLPENATDKSYSFTVGDPSVASISNEGVITGLQSGTTTITATSTDGGFADSVAVKVVHQFTISTNETAGVTVSVKDKAAEGELVYVDLEFDSSVLTVKKVLANNIELGTSEGRYYFYMPAENVTINVVTEAVVTYYSVVNGNSSAVRLNTVGAYQFGETVNISFTLLPGYQFTGNIRVLKNINAFDPADKIEVAFTFKNGVISFEMPNENVEVVVEVEASIFSVSKVDTYSHISSLRADDVYTSISNGQYDIKYGQTVKVYFVSDTSSSCAKARPTGIYIPEMDATFPAENGVSTFVMPHYNVTMQVLTESVFRNMSLLSSEHITLTAYTKDADGAYTLITDNKAVYEDKVYLKVTSEDDTVYQVRSLTGSYTAEGQSYTSKLTPTLESDGYYSFTMPKVKPSTVLEITLVEKDMSLFASAEFVGSYLGVEIYGTGYWSKVTAFSSSKATTIDSAGIMKQGSNEHTINSYDPESHTLSITNSSNSKGNAYFDTNLLVSNYTYGNSAVVTTDMTFLVKKLSANDDDSIYGINARFINQQYYFGQVTRDGETYLTFVADYLEQKIYKDVVFTFTTGTVVTDTSAEYDVSANDTVLYHVAGSTVSAYDGLQGTYVNGDVTLVLSGTGSATYNGETYSYTINEDDTVKLQRAIEAGIETVVISLGEGTFTVVSTSQSGLAPVYGKYFQINTSYDYSMQIYFDRADKCIIYITYEPDTSPISSSSSYYDYNDDVAYTYDSDAETITLTSDLYGTATFTIELDAETNTYKMTCTESTFFTDLGFIDVDEVANEFTISE